MWNTLTEIKADSVGNTEATNEFDCTGMTWFICLQLSSSSICRYHSPSVYAALSAAWLITPKAAKYLEHFSNAFWQISWNAASLMDWIAFHQELHWRLEPNCEQLCHRPLGPMVLSITIIKSVFGTITLLCVSSIAYFWPSLLCEHTYADTQLKSYEDADVTHSWPSNKGKNHWWRVGRWEEEWGPGLWMREH